MDAIDRNGSLDPISHTCLLIPDIAAIRPTIPDALGGGVEVNAHLFYDHQSEGRQVDQSGGDIMGLDFAVGQRLSRWTAVAWDIRDIRPGPDGVARNGHRPPAGWFFETLRLEAIVGHDIPGSRAFIRVKSDMSAITHDSPGVTNVFAALGLLF